MEKEFNIASGITNRLGTNRYFLTLDYDNISIDDIVESITEMQRQFSLSDAKIYKTASGCHVYFFFDNHLTAEDCQKILRSDSKVDHNFVDMFEKMVKEDDGVTLRTNGKYEKQDIFFSRVITGTRKPSLLEKNVGLSLEQSVNSLIKDPLYDNSRFRIKTDGSPVPGEEKKILVKQPEIKKAEKREQTEQTNKKVDSTQVINEIFPENRKITTLKKSWYSGYLHDGIARLIAASAEKRELGLLVPKMFLRKAPEFFNIRTFFLRNDLSREKTVKNYDFMVKNAKVEEFPYNFFQSHAILDTDNIEDVKMFGKDKKALSEDMSKNIEKYIKGFDIIFDMDSKDVNSDESYQEAKKLRNLFLDMELPFVLNFSGSKGFHIRIPAEEVNKSAPELIEFLKDKPENIFLFFKALKEFAAFHNIKIDENAYNGELRSFIRVLWSIHWETGSVVKPLTDVEFDSLEGKTLQEIRDCYNVDNLLKGNKAKGIKALNFLDISSLTIRVLVEGKYYTWQEMKDSGKFIKITAGKPERENYRDNYINPIAKELRNLKNTDLKKFTEIVNKGIYEDCLISVPTFVDLHSGGNYDYRRKGDGHSLRSFVLELINK